ncbi:hypothetical protein ACQ4PT_023803 [Festuca glaucescens]
MGVPCSKFTGGNAKFALGIAGNATTLALLVVPMFTFVRPVWNDGSVGDGTVHAYLVAMFNSVMWALYAASSLPAGTLPFFYINEVGVLLQLVYIIFYLGFATEEKQRRHDLVLLLAVDAVCVMMTALVYFMVMVTHRWSVTFVAVIASAFGASMHVIPLFDLVPNIVGIVSASLQILVYLAYRVHGYSNRRDKGCGLEELTVSPV